MSGTRGLVPAAVAVALGIFTGMTVQDNIVNRHGQLIIAFVAGYYTFQPAFQGLDAERRLEKQPPGFQVANENSKETPRASTTSSTSSQAQSLSPSAPQTGIPVHTHETSTKSENAGSS